MVAAAARWAPSAQARQKHEADETYFDTERYIETLLWIRSKQKRMIPFKLNPPQRIHMRRTSEAARNGHTRHIILKARQMGFTTLELGRMFHSCATQDLVAAALIAHEKDTTRRLLEIPKTFYEHLPLQERPPIKYDNREEYHFAGLDSRLYIGTAGSLGFGRGLTLHHAHLSEFGFWPDPETLMAGLSESIPLDGWVTMESTPNGVGGMFYDTYMEAKSGHGEYMAHFYPWFLDPTYALPVDPRAPFEPTHEERGLVERVAREWVDPSSGEPLQITHEQLSFRRWKQATLKVKFPQEYPEDDISCIEGAARVGTHRGLIPIRDVKVGDRLASGTVVAASLIGQRDVVRLTTKRGHVLTCTPEHLLALPSGDWVQARDARLVDAICLDAPALADVRHVERWTTLGGVECALAIDERWAEFLGYYMGDGSFHGTELVLSGDVRDSDLTERLTDLVAALFGARPRLQLMGSHKGGTALRLTRRAFCDLFEQLGIVQQADYRETAWLKRKVCVPDVIWRSPAPIVERFLAALFEADGWVAASGNTVKFFARDIDFARDVQLLLLALGVHCKVAAVTKVVGERTYPGAELMIGSAHIAAFTRIGFLSERKRARLALHGQPTGRRGGGRPAAPLDFTDQVMSIEPAGLAEVFDLQMSGAPQFDAGGLLVHNCFLVSGSTVFDGLLLASLMRQLARPPLRVAEPYPVKGREAFALKIWQEPQAGVEYVAGSDVAEGEEVDTGLDFSGTMILRRDNGEQVADLHGWWPPHIFARKSAELCERYNDAFWGVERNNHGHSVLNTASNVIHYPRLYRHLSYDPKDGREKERLGWPTDPVTKPLMIDELHEALAAGTVLIRDEDFYREAMAFIFLGNGKMGARSGVHDDRVIKAAITHQMRKFRPKTAGMLVADGSEPTDDDPAQETGRESDGFPGGFGGVP